MPMPGMDNEAQGPLGGFEGGFEVGQFEGVGDFVDQGFVGSLENFDRFVKDAAQDSFKASGGTPGVVLANTTTAHQLRSIDLNLDGNSLSNPAFLKFYKQENVSTTAAGTTLYNIQADIRLDADVRAFGAGNSGVRHVPNNHSIGHFQFNLPATFYETFDGNAVFAYTNLPNQFAGMDSCDGCTANVTITLKNANDQVQAGDGLANIATKAEHQVTIKNSLGTTIAETQIPQSPPPLAERQAGNSLSPPW
jgi:hypothetical protein